jgi:hypothetical protein
MVAMDRRDEDVSEPNTRLGPKQANGEVSPASTDELLAA